MEEFSRDATVAGQKEIADAIKGLGVIATPVDNTLTEAGQAADAKAAGDRITSLETVVGDSEDGLVKDVTSLATTVGDADSGLVKGVADNASDISNLQGLVSADGTTYTLFGKVITFENDNTISWADPVTSGEE